MIEIVNAPAHLQIQDRGFLGKRNLGLPRAGAMDPAALALGNALVGNAADAAAFEWALGGGAVRFHCDATICATGARVRGRVGQRMLVGDIAIEVTAGTMLEVDRFTSGRFLYLCVSPPIAIEATFGSRSTYTPARIGGFEGRRLRTGDSIPLQSGVAGNPGNSLPRPDYLRSVMRIRPGPESQVLDGRLLDHLLKTSFTISATSDRTGYRLDGSVADITGLTQIVSEPACEGAIQITDGGTPIVLMADGPTIGGYNKVAIIVSADLPVFAQKTPGEIVRFTLD